VKARLCLFACAAICLRAESPPSIPAPFYTPSSVVNGANPKAGALAPNTIGTLYGRDLSFNTVAVTNEHITEGRLPVTLPGSGVSLQIEGRSAFLYYVSPTQINFLVPPTLTAGPADFQLVLDGRAAERIRIELAAASPALFASDPESVVATHLDASVVTSSHPATANEIIVLYATGLGATSPRQVAGQVPSGIARISRAAEFQVMLDGQPVDRANILYVGAAPGFAGLYQINLKLPSNLPQNPEVRIGFSDAMSPMGLRLPSDRRNP
jgi:uncharacterized protein (TIGR03437 family)